MATLSDFSGVMTVIAPAGNAVVGIPVKVQGAYFLPQSAALSGAPFNGLLLHPTMGKKVIGAPKTAAEAWTAGQKLYFIAATGVLTTTVGTNDFAGFAAADAIAAATSGDFIPASAA